MDNCSYGKIYIFRGKTPNGKNGEWVFGNLITYNNKYYILPEGGHLENESQVDPNTVTQFIHRTDMCDMFIFEGDIVRTVSPTHSCEEIYLVIDTHTLLKNGEYHYFPYDMKLEVIGNIWDNRELLDEETQELFDTYRADFKVKDTERVTCEYCSNDYKYIHAGRDMNSKNKRPYVFTGIDISIEPDDDMLYVQSVADVYEPNYAEVKIPINFCPMCGRVLRKENK